MFVVKCQNCGAEVELMAWHDPVTYQTNDADAFGPRSFLIIAAGWMIHRCEITDENQKWNSTG